MEGIDTGTLNESAHTILEQTASMPFTVGTNLTGGLAAAAWRFLLPSLELDCVLFLGQPDAATCDAFTPLAKRCLCAAKWGSSHGEGTKTLPANVEPVRLQRAGGFALPAASVDLIVVCRRNAAAQLAASPALLHECRRILKNSGAVYVETTRRERKKIATQFQRIGLAACNAFWLTPFRGEMRTAFPLGARKSAMYLFKNVLFGQSTKKRLLSRTGSLLCSLGLLPALAPRQAAIFIAADQRQPGTAPAANRPPTYLVELAGRAHKVKGSAGGGIGHMVCGFSARGKFNANKNIFFLFEPGASEPAIVAKMTRAPGYNHRLENEYTALSRLHCSRFVPEQTYPMPLFFGEHAGLAISAQKAIQGRPFRRQAQATPDCPLAAQAIEWIVDLGEHSAKPVVTAAQVADALQSLFSTFRNIYHLSTGEAVFLERQIAALGNDRAPFPLVFMHGDLGTWNMLADAGGSIVVLDWEAADPAGMPLWDFYYFYRSFAMWVARQKGHRDSLRNFAAAFLQASPLRSIFATTIERYCRMCDLERTLAIPLFYLCWMHRALKEAMRLRRDELMSGHYINLLRLCIARSEDIKESLFAR